jgi:5-methylcytosine-specific restriction endonuclease McrA
MPTISQLSLFDLGKTCPRCKTEKPFDQFYANRAQRDGMQPYCKVCHNATRKQYQSEASRQRERDRSREFMRQYRIDFPEKQRESRHKYYQSHKAQVAAHGYIYRAANSERLLKRAREYHYRFQERNNTRRKLNYQSNDGAGQKRKWRQSNLERARATIREWRKNNPEKTRFFDKAKCAKRRSAMGSHTAQDERLQYARQNGNCHWCETPVGSNFHIDHIIPLSKGGTNNPDNICVACPTCNNRKHCMMPDEWRKRLAEIKCLESKTKPMNL